MSSIMTRTIRVSTVHVWNTTVFLKLELKPWTFRPSLESFLRAWGTMELWRAISNWLYSLAATCNIFVEMTLVFRHVEWSCSDSQGCKRSMISCTSPAKESTLYTYATLSVCKGPGLTKEEGCRCYRHQMVTRPLPVQSHRPIAMS